MINDNEKLVIGEKIFHDINVIFDNDDVIDELGFIMDKVPSAICIEHKLGMSLGSLKPLFIYCSNKLNEIMKGGISSSSLDNNSNNDIIILLSQITRGLLLVRGDYPPAFVYRKQLIILGKLMIEDELRFLNMLFTQHPKSPSSWQHRRWCLLTRSNHNSNDNHSNTILSIKELDNELWLCSTSAESYPKNYYAWMHRLWLLQYMDYIYIEKELEFIDNWLLAHVSDHSAVSHKHQVLNRLIKSKSNNEEIIITLIKALIKNENLLILRPGNEALWYDRRNIMLLLLLKMKSIKIDQWNHIYTKRLSQYITDFNANNGSIIDDFDVIVLDSWGKNIDNKSNYYDLYHNSNNNTKITLETLGIAMSNDDNHDSIENFLLFWLHSEILFCRNCSLDENAWNYDKQRQLAMRYISFFYYKFIVLCNTSFNNENHDNSNDDRNDNAFSKLQILNELSKSISSKQPNSSMLSTLMNGLKVAVTELLVEDKFTRIWQTIYDCITNTNSV